MQEARVGYLGWEYPREKEMTIHSSILAWKVPWTEEPGRVHGVTESDTNEQLTHYLSMLQAPAVRLYKGRKLALHV